MLELLAILGKARWVGSIEPFCLKRTQSLSHIVIKDGCQPLGKKQRCPCVSVEPDLSEGVQVTPLTVHCSIQHLSLIGMLLKHPHTQHLTLVVVVV